MSSEVLLGLVADENTKRESVADEGLQRLKQMVHNQIRERCYGAAGMKKINLRCSSC